MLYPAPPLEFEPPEGLACPLPCGSSEDGYSELGAYDEPPAATAGIGVKAATTTARAKVFVKRIRPTFDTQRPDLASHSADRPAAGEL